MADNPNRRDKRDRSRVSSQDFEIQHVASKLRVSPQAVAGAKRAVGNNRERVETYIRERKKAGAYK
jgi:hypothetical protein